MSDKCKHCSRCRDGCTDICKCCGVCNACGLQTRPAVAAPAPVYIPVPYAVPAPAPVITPYPIWVQPNPFLVPFDGATITCRNSVDVTGCAAPPFLGECQTVTITPEAQLNNLLWAREVGASSPSH